VGFYVRKSVKVGPFRFNLSKSGIGVSTGIKGFRVGTGPRGNYINMGTGGIYYRTSLSRKNAQPLPQSHQDIIPPLENKNNQDNLIEIESGSVLEMVDSSSAALLEEIKEKHKRPKYGPIALAITVIGCLLFKSIFPIVAILGVVLIAISYQWDELKKSVVLFYELESANENVYQRLHNAFSKMTEINKIWHIEASRQLQTGKETQAQPLL